MNRNFKQPTAISINNNWDAWHLGLRRWANFGVSFVGLKSDDQFISKKKDVRFKIDQVLKGKLPSYDVYSGDIAGMEGKGRVKLYEIV